MTREFLTAVCWMLEQTAVVALKEESDGARVTAFRRDVGNDARVTKTSREILTAVKLTRTEKRLSMVGWA
jgi:hypothetical protein